MWINSRARMVGDAGHLRRRKNEGPSAMIATNRDLTAMQELLDREILRLQRIASDGAEPGLLNRRLVALCRQRIAVCAALVNGGSKHRTRWWYSLLMRLTMRLASWLRLPSDRAPVRRPPPSSRCPANAA